MPTEESEHGLQLNASPYTDLPEVFEPKENADLAPQLAPTEQDEKEAVLRAQYGVDNKAELTGSQPVVQEGKILHEAETPMGKVLSRWMKKRTTDSDHNHRSCGRDSYCCWHRSRFYRRP